MDDKKNTSILVLILFILVLSRIALYLIFGTGFVDTDAKMRYLPQVDELAQSLGRVFSQIGPAYSLFLLFVKKTTNNMIASSVLVQHIIGVITGVLVFNYFKRINLFLAAFVTIFIYAGWLALWLEHTILRESLTAFFFVLLVLMFSLAVKKEKYFKLPYAFLAGFTGLILVLFRIEFIVIVILFPLIFFFVRIGKPLTHELGKKRFVMWCLGYYLPLFAVLLVLAPILKNQDQKKFQYGTLFDASYYSLAYNGFMPRIFYYENSHYPGLLEKYQSSFEIHKDELNNLTSVSRREKTNRSLAIVDNATEEYLSEHPEINFSVHQLMDQVYLEIIKRNTFIYLQGVAVNFKEHLVGMAEMHSVLAKSTQLNLLASHVSGKDPRNIKDLKPASTFDKAFVLYFKSMVIFSKILFWLFLISSPILVFRWKKMPVEVTISLFVAFLHLSVLAIVADPSHRFRYPIDPFLYFLQLYLILYLFKTISFKNIKFSRVLHNDGNEK